MRTATTVGFEPTRAEPHALATRSLRPLGQVVCVYPHRESNSGLRLRRTPCWPLHYGGGAPTRNRTRSSRDTNAGVLPIDFGSCSSGWFRSIRPRGYEPRALPLRHTAGCLQMESNHHLSFSVRLTGLEPDGCPDHYATGAPDGNLTRFSCGKAQAHYTPTNTRALCAPSTPYRPSRILESNQVLGFTRPAPPP